VPDKQVFELIGSDVVNGRRSQGRVVPQTVLYGHGREVSKERRQERGEEKKN